MASPSRCALAVLSGALSFACGVPVSDSKYEVVPEPFERIVDAYAGGSAACEECVRNRCQGQINACVDADECTELSLCVHEKGSPAGQTICASKQGGVTFDALAANAALRECWVGCQTDCSVGRAWGCLGAYHEAVPFQPDATVRQSLTYICDVKAAAGVSVTYCTYDDDCIPEVVTDEEGTYTVELPMHTKPSVAGWRGFRRVAGGELPMPHRLDRNLPIASDQVESTLLMSSGCAERHLSALLEEVGMANLDSGTVPVIGVQVFDCQFSGADGVELTVETAPDAIIKYAELEGRNVSYHSDSTKAAGEGLALIVGLPPGEHTVVARERTSGEQIARASVTVTDKELVLYSLLPDSVK